MWYCLKTSQLWTLKSGSKVLFTKRLFTKRLFLHTPTLTNPLPIPTIYQNTHIHASTQACAQSNIFKKLLLTRHIQWHRSTKGYLDDTPLVAVDSHLGARQELVLLLSGQLCPKDLCHPLNQLSTNSHSKCYTQSDMHDFWLATAKVILHTHGSWLKTSHSMGHFTFLCLSNSETSFKHFF